MKLIQSKILNQIIVVAENEEEYEDCIAKAKELDATLYTQREIEYIFDTTIGMSAEEKQNNLVIVNKIKKTFLGFYLIPKNWKPKK